jgi:YVTN family beta-propeller protein
MRLRGGFFGLGAGRLVGVLFGVATVCCLVASSAAAIHVTKINVGSNPDGVSSDGTHVWVTNYGENTVSEIEASSGTVSNTIPVGSDPKVRPTSQLHVASRSRSSTWSPANR